MKTIPNLFYEAKVQLGSDMDEAQTPSGKIEARATTWGAREGADGRRFNYQPEGFAQWADEFAEAGKPMPMFLNHNDMGIPVGQWDEISFDDEGMTASGKLFMETSAGADVYHILKESPMLFGGVSVGAYADEACMVDGEGNPLISGDNEEEGYFQITKGGLREISVVMYPNKILELRDADKEIVKETPLPSDLEAVVNEADAILKALQERELLKALSKRIK